MSRKSAYALKARDPAFAAAWDAARKVPEVPRAPKAPDSGNCVRQGDKRGRSATTILSASTLELMRQLEEERRDACLARLSERAAAIRRDSAALAARRPLP
jgi:hypothetical protein